MDTSFKDSKGRDWTVVIDGYVLGRARSHGKLDLSGVINGAMKGNLCPDPAVLLELAFYGCEHHSRIQSGKVTKEDFLRALKGSAMQPALEAAASGLMECFGVDLEGEEELPDPSESGLSSGSGAKPIGSDSPALPASIPGGDTGSPT